MESCFLDVQDPVGSLSPRKIVGQIIAVLFKPAGMRSAELDDRVAELMEQVGLWPALRKRYSQAVSLGQSQSIGEARSIAIEPRANHRRRGNRVLNVSLRPLVLDLIIKLLDELDLSYMLISHDMQVIRSMCDRVALMYRGRIVEAGDTSPIVNRLTHKYTKALSHSTSRSRRPLHP